MIRWYVHLETAWKAKRIILLCVVGILSILLIYSHREIRDSLHSMSRRAIVRTLMNAREKDFDLARRYRVRGPLTIAQVETEFFGKPLDSLSRTGISENTDPGYMEWEQIMKSNHRDGDELYFVTSDKRSWARLAGWRGYVLVRGNELVAVFTTAVN